MELNDFLRKEMNIPDFKKLSKKDYLTKMYMKFVQDVGNPRDYKVLVYNEFGVYFINEFPGLDALLVISKDCSVMDLKPLEDKICNERFVIFVPVEDNDMWWVKDAVGGLMGKVEKIYVLKSMINDLLDSPYRYSCPFLNGEKCANMNRKPEKDCRDCRLWTQHWKNSVCVRFDGRIEWVCRHGVGHPDPDVVRLLGRLYDKDVYGVHGCDGCCSRNDYPGRPRSDDDYWRRGDSYAV